MPSRNTIPSIRGSIGTAHRAAEITSALLQFGFGEFVRQVGLDRFLPGGRSKTPDGADLHDAPLQVRFRLLLEELGPTFIKAGQILSTRPDLIPTEWTTELTKLQSEVPPEPWEGKDGIKALLEIELGPSLEENFESIEEEALAAASVAQVHRAVLRTGEHVVIKVLRPSTRERMHADLALMRWLSRVTQSYFENVGVDVDAVIDEFSKQLERETDLTIEARSTQRMQRDFEDNPNISFPRVYDTLSTRSVLVMEEIHGRLLSKLDLDTLSNEEREQIVKNGANAVFRQCLVLGFFHADPHPGNIIIRDQGRICFIDCGMTGLIDPGTVSQLAQIVQGALKRDLDRVVRTAVELGRADTSLAEDRGFRTDAWHIIDRFHSGSIEAIGMGELLEDFFAAMRRYRLRCPADIVYLIKALATIEGVAQRIAPKFDLAAYVHPYVEDLVKARYSFSGLKQRFEDAALAYGDLIEDLPHDLADLLKAARRNQLTVNLNLQGRDEITREIERASMNISWAVGVGSLILGASIFMLADSVDRQMSVLTIIGAVTFAIAVILAGYRLIVSWRRSG